MLVTEADGPTSTPLVAGSATSYTPSRIFALWQIIYAERIWAEGSSSSKPSRSRFRIKFLRKLRT